MITFIYLLGLASLLGTLVKVILHSRVSPARKTVRPGRLAVTSIMLDSEIKYVYILVL